MYQKMGFWSIDVLWRSFRYFLLRMNKILNLIQESESKIEIRELSLQMPFNSTGFGPWQQNYRG